MSQDTYLLTIPSSIKAAATRAATRDGVSLDRWIADAVARRVDAAEFFAKRSAGRSLEELDSILAKVPDRPPEPGDELPEGWTPPDWLKERR